MPRVTKYPRLRSHVRRGKSGQRWVYYYYDMRADGGKDVPLGRDHPEALARWDEIHNRRPRARGRVQEAIDRFRRDVLPGYENKETKRGYAKHLRRIERAFSETLWEEIDFGALKAYLVKRSAKTQANREMAVFKLVWDRAVEWRMTALPWPAAGRRDWKNAEQPRESEVSDALFDAVYAKADQTLMDAMDIASATGMRLTDVRTVALPPGDLLRLRAHKTGKKADFDVSLSAILPSLIARRRAIKARHTMLLSTPTGRPVSERMLTDRWQAAREAAAAKAAAGGNPGFAEDIRALLLRDMRKRAADLAVDDEEATTLLQHSSKRTTVRHYRSKVVRLKPVR